MRISVIIPVHNNRRDLSDCLSALVSSSLSDSEIIVVDDASTDDTFSTAERMGARVFRLEKNSGPAAARNHGARQAHGEILFFVDADVVLRPGAIQLVSDMFESQPDLAALFGSYDARPRAQGLVSRYRNLLHHFVHQNGHPEASTFWAGCGAIRRSVFEAVGGFDERRFPRPSIEDIELGYRLLRAGYRIRLVKALLGTHLKRWDLRSLLRTDITCRAIPWSRLIIETRRMPDDLNLKLGQRVSFVLVALACLFLAFAVFRIEMLVFSAAALLAVIVLNRELYGFFFQQGGLLFSLVCIPLHLLYYLYSGFSYLYVWITMRCKGPAIQKILWRRQKG